VVFEDLAGFPDKIATADAGDLQQVGRHVHRADLPLVDEGDQRAGGIVEWGLTATEFAGGPAGPAATLLGVALLCRGGLGRGEHRGQVFQRAVGEAAQPGIGQPGERGLATTGRPVLLTDGHRFGGTRDGLREQGVVPGAMDSMPLQR
jgi:hypothetical protein